MSIFVIAEAGVNHGGNPDVAFDLIDAAADAGADAVKFQAFTADRLEPPGVRRDMLQRLELLPPAFSSLAQYSRARNIEFMATPFDTDWLKFLVEHCQMQRIKLASTSLTDDALVRAAAATGLPVLLSTGMATLLEIQHALSLFPAEANITLMYCVSAYPTSVKDVNLDRFSMLYFRGIKLGLSDHTLSTFTPVIAASAFELTAVEKHMTCPSGSGPDHHISVSPEIFAEIVTGLRQIDDAFGTGQPLGPLPCEAPVYLIRKEREEWRKFHALSSGTVGTDA